MWKVWKRTTEVEPLTTLVEKLSAGEWGCVVDAASYTALRPLAAALAALTGVIRNFAQQTQVAADKVAAAVDQAKEALVRTAAEGERVAGEARSCREAAWQLQQQAGEADQLMEGVRASTQTMLDAAAGIHESSIDARQRAEQGQQAVSGVGRSMQGIHAQSAELADKIGALARAAQDIQRLLASIHGIASQTQLLSLNASIEAARAGEHGRGFAVVAEEIQVLSEGSSKAAREATQLLAEIELGVTAAERAVQEEGRAVRAGEQAVAEALEHLDAIREASRRTEKQLAEAGAVRQEQAATAQQMAAVTRRMNELCGELLHCVERTEAALQRQQLSQGDAVEMGGVLQRVAEVLQQETARIRLQEADAQVQAQAQAVLSLLRGLARELAALPEGGHAGCLEAWLAGHPELEAVWSNRDDGSFLVSLPPAGLANAKGREWFQRALAEGQYVSAVYISAISSQPCLTVSASWQAPDGRRGVVGADLALGSC